MDIANYYYKKKLSTPLDYTPTNSKKRILNLRILSSEFSKIVVALKQKHIQKLCSRHLPFLKK